MQSDLIMERDVSYLSCDKKQLFFSYILWIITSISIVIMHSGFGGFDPYRYVIIAHQMMVNHNYFLPYFQGEIYSDKPPLMFWSFIIGWKLFGFNLWWPQFTIILETTLSLFTTQKISRMLWPQKKSISIIAPYIMLGMYQWLWNSKQIRVDSLNILFILLSILCLLKVLSGKPKFWSGYVLATFLGVMSKGPMIFLYTLLPSLMIPFINEQRSIKVSAWYSKLILFSLLGLLLSLIWVIPAAIEGGHEYTRKILYGQILDRQHHTTSPNQIGYYFKHLIFWLFPWFIFPGIWQTIKKNNKNLFDFGVKYCLIIIAISLFVFSLFNQKEPHYMLPSYYFFALIFANLLSYNNNNQLIISIYSKLMGFLILGFATFLLFLPNITHQFSLNIQLYLISMLDDPNIRYWSLPPLILAFIYLQNIRPIRSINGLVILTATTIVLLQFFMNVKAIPLYEYHYKGDGGVLEKVKALNKQHKPIAYVGRNSSVSKIDFDENHGYIIYKLKKYDSLKKYVSKIPNSTLYNWTMAHTNGFIVTDNKFFIYCSIGHARPINWYYDGRKHIVAIWAVNNLNKECIKHQVLS